jgi:hypothetical protein
MRTPDNTRVATGGWVYIMTNRRKATLYVGATTDSLGEHASIGLVSLKDLQNNRA